jgi:predicted N-acetyltransferase YhbS
MIIRPENSNDIPEIRALMTAAFKGASHSAGAEGAIVDGLRAGGASIFSTLISQATSIQASLSTIRPLIADRSVETRA